MSHKINSYENLNPKNAKKYFGLDNTKKRITIYIKQRSCAIICWCKNQQSYIFLEKFSDLISSIFILVIDILYLLGELVNNFSKKITNFAFVSLNFVGLIALPFYIHLLNKSIQDMSFAKKVDNNKIFYASFIKTILTISNIFLLSSCFFAASMRMRGLLDLTQSIYAITIPLGSISLSTMIGLDIFHYWNNKKLLFYLKKIDSKMIDPFLQSFNDICKKDIKIDYKKCADIHESMDKDTLKIFKQNLLKAKNDPLKTRKLFYEVIVKNIQTQQFVAFSDLALKTLGYLGIFFANLFVGTYIQAAIWTFMAFLYTTQLSIQKIKQYKEQKKAILINTLA
ncbi:MAG: hypothetical protein KR126chlam6_00570 [Candidatus Anoxychlamydiales bacterium]|nr:hypothetical protein [Candidatus Anoxychlamydiales bacterium]